MKRHKCHDCKYYYKSERTKTKDIYNALTDNYESWVVEKKLDHTCSVNSGGTFIDAEAPQCKEFESE